jgi:hypothetical protein
MDSMATGEPVGGPAQEAVDRLLDQGFLDELMAKVDEGGVQLTGEGGFLPELLKRVLEAGLQWNTDPRRAAQQALQAIYEVRSRIPSIVKSPAQQRRTPLAHEAERLPLSNPGGATRTPTR